MKNLYYILFLIIIFTNTIKAQIVISDESEISQINENAMIELKTNTTSKGVLLPKVALTSLTNPTPIATHTAGMVVYNTASFTNNSPGFYYNDGTKWNKLGIGSKVNVGDVKYAAISYDHNGWYLLNGRAITTLSSTNAINNANSLGFSTNLPNTVNRFLKSKSTNQQIGILVGNSSVKLTQTNLPNGPFTGGASSTDGNHTHTLFDRGTGSVATVVLPNGPVSGAAPGQRTETTANAGAHTHTFSFNYQGENQPIEITPKYFSSYIFVYLGE